MIYETRLVSIFAQVSRIELGRRVTVVVFFQKDQRITRVIRGTHPFLPPSPVSPEQILAFHLHPCPAGRLRHRLNTNRNAAVYQSRIDTAPSLESSGRCDEIRPPDRKSFLSLDAFVYFPHLELLDGTTIFFPPPIFMRVTCYARVEDGGDFSNTFPPGSETMRYSQTRQPFPQYLDYCKLFMFLFHETWTTSFIFLHGLFPLFLYISLSFSRLIFGSITFDFNSIAFRIR